MHVLSPIPPNSSSIVTKALMEAYRSGLKFKVIVVDSRPKLEGTAHYAPPTRYYPLSTAL